MLAPPQHSGFTFNILAPLSALEQCEIIDIRSSRPIHISDDDHKTLATSWPSVQFLKLVCSTRLEGVSPRIGDPTATIESLRHYARNCPKLHTLGISLNANMGHVLPVDTFGTLQSPLTTLKLGISPISRNAAQRVALHLDRCFPNIRSIVCESANYPHDQNEKSARIANRENWKLVEEFLSNMQDARRREREGR